MIGTAYAVKQTAHRWRTSKLLWLWQLFPPLQHIKWDRDVYIPSRWTKYIPDGIIFGKKKGVETQGIQRNIVLIV